MFYKNDCPNIPTDLDDMLMYDDISQQQDNVQQTIEEINEEQNELKIPENELLNWEQGGDDYKLFDQSISSVEDIIGLRLNSAQGQQIFEHLRNNCEFSYDGSKVKLQSRLCQIDWRGQIRQHQSLDESDFQLQQIQLDLLKEQQENQNWRRQEKDQSKYSRKLLTLQYQKRKTRRRWKQFQKDKSSKKTSIFQGQFEDFNNYWIVKEPSCTNDHRQYSQLVYNEQSHPGNYQEQFGQFYNSQCQKYNDDKESYQNDAGQSVLIFDQAKI